MGKSKRNRSRSCSASSEDDHVSTRKLLKKLRREFKSIKQQQSRISRSRSRSRRRDSISEPRHEARRRVQSRSPCARSRSRGRSRSRSFRRHVRRERETKSAAPAQLAPSSTSSAMPRASLETATLSRSVDNSADRAIRNDACSVVSEGSLVDLGTCSAQSILGDTRGICNATQERKIDDACSVLSKDVIDMLGDDPESTAENGSLLHNELAKRWKVFLQNGLKKDDLLTILSKYDTPSNLSLLTAPILNPEVKAALQKPILSNLQAVAEKCMPAEFLFGTDLSDKLKSLKAIESASKELKSVPKPFFNRKRGGDTVSDRSKPGSSRPLNAFRPVRHYPETRPARSQKFAYRSEPAKTYRNKNQSTWKKRI
ncbi:uncharacterized protein LOC116166259 [Photinus pyralis]|uniref:uncharacterized protein LOC116166259 n=1 Tax=Photinus pyralis TaxID=7054 RepID=UPI0012673AB0|nr:uncharacterized protein LOC116166259 [Photinus pyralis]